MGKHLTLIIRRYIIAPDKYEHKMGYTTERVSFSFCVFFVEFLRGVRRMKVNGKNHTINDNQNLLDFLESNQYDITKIAVERNGEIIPKLMYRQVNLKENDTLEIVSFVGGG